MTDDPMNDVEVVNELAKDAVSRQTLEAGEWSEE